MKKINGYWTDQKLKEEALKYNTKRDFRKFSSSAYVLTKNKRLLGKFCKHMVQLRNDKYTKKDLKKVAKLFNRRIDFMRQKSGAYDAALTFERTECGFLDSICSHMRSTKEIKRDLNLVWTKEKVRAVALKCKSKTELRNKYPSAHKAAYRDGYIDEACSHIVKTTDNRERRFQKKLKTKISQMFNKMKVSFVINEEVSLKNSGHKSRIDLILKLPDYNIFMPIELKHDKSFWSEFHIKQQICRYNKSLAQENGFTGTYLVSPQGKYGISSQEFLSILGNIVKKEELVLPMIIS